MVGRLSLRRPPPRPLPDAEFPRLKQAIIARTGHFYYQDKDDLLWDRVAKRLAATRASGSGDYLRRLADASDGEAEWAALEAEITIGETFFFRYAEQFTALRETILPDLLARRAESRRLRIWSAGCATGAEPYSIAILLADMLGESLPDWRISILGTDINETFLEAARQARFGRWALRAVSNPDRDRRFVESGRSTWTLKSVYRGLVRFERGNLLDLLGPVPPLELTDFDLILCRNVLIYFHADAVTQIVQALGQRMAEGGWMLLGHAEPNPGFSAFLSTVSLPGAVAYRPPGEEGPASLAPTLQPWSPSLPPEAPRPASVAAKPLPRPRPQEKPAEPVSAAPLEALIEQIRSRADAGDYAGAETKRAEALAIAPDNAVLHFFGGLIGQAQGHPAKAEASFQKALYLEPDFIMARYHLGLARLARGHSASGRKAIAVAASMAGTLTADARLQEGAGLTAGELRELARLHF